MKHARAIEFDKTNLPAVIIVVDVALLPMLITIISSCFSVPFRDLLVSFLLETHVFTHSGKLAAIPSFFKVIDLVTWASFKPPYYNP